MSIPEYPGDQKAREFVSRFLSHTTFEELRAALAGNMVGLEFAGPNQVLERFREDEDGSSADKSPEEISKFMGVFFGLWNKLGEHQDESNPFSFTPIPKDLDFADREGWRDFAWGRLHELDEFLISLEETGTYSEEELVAGYDFDFLPHALDRARHELESILSVREKMKINWRVVASVIEDIDRLMIELWSSFVSRIKQQRLMRIAAEKAANLEEGTFVKVQSPGRNNPCPCGSGKKFKKCCLH